MGKKYLLFFFELDSQDLSSLHDKSESDSENEVSVPSRVTVEMVEQMAQGFSKPHASCLLIPRNTNEKGDDLHGSDDCFLDTEDNELRDPSYHPDAADNETEDEEFDVATAETEQENGNQTPEQAEPTTSDAIASVTEQENGNQTTEQAEPTTSHAITAETEEENGNQTLEQAEPTTTRSVCEDEVVQVNGADEPVRVRQGKKRKRDPASWARSVRKLKSARGEAFVNSQGKYVSEKKVGPLCQCKNKCFTILGEENVKRIFTEFYSLGDKALQDSHIFGLIQAKPVARKRSRSGARADYRQSSYSYSVRLEDGTRKEVCAAAFRSLHGIGKTRFEKICRPNLTLPPQDRCGKHGNQKKISSALRQKVRQHIASFPQQQSHYSRHQNAQRTYLPENLSVRRMWLLYLIENEPVQIDNIKQKRKCTAEVKLHTYREEFNQLNIGFGLPRSDTCAQCDRLEISIAEAEASNDQTKASHLRQEKEKHHRKAEKAYSTLSTLTEEAKRSTELDMYTFDFQQNLPIPSLTTSDMFYSRMLWVYNFGIHDASTGDGIMHIWDETVAKRGSSEVCSLLKETVLERHTEAKPLVLFSDSCCGQNKNKAILTLWAQLSESEHYEQIDHFYLIRGHTFLSNDRDFAVIEKYKKKHHPLLPTEYTEIIKGARIIQPFEVKTIKGEDIKDYKTLGDKTIKSTLKDESGTRVKLREVMWYSYGQSQEMDFENNEQVTISHPKQVWCRYSHNDMEPWKKVDVMKRGASLTCDPEPKYTMPIPIKAAKYCDLVALGDKHLVPEHVGQFYAGLPHDGATTVTDPSESDADDGNGGNYV